MTPTQEELAMSLIKEAINCYIVAREARESFADETEEVPFAVLTDFVEATTCAVIALAILQAPAFSPTAPPSVDERVRNFAEGSGPWKEE